MEWPAFIEALAQMEVNEEPDEVAMLGLMAVAFWQGNPTMSRAKVKQTLERVWADDAEIVGTEEDEESPPVEGGETPPPPTNESNASPDANSDETSPNGSGVLVSPTGSPEPLPL